MECGMVATEKGNYVGQQYVEESSVCEGYSGGNV